MSDEELATAEQDSWRELAVVVRIQLLKRCADMAAMEPDELRQFVAAIQAAFWLEVNAASFDHRITLENTRPVAE
jgi:hypothetical protein